MLNRILVFSVSFISLFFLFNVIVQAGGCCFKEVSIEEDGVAGISPALIQGRLYNKAYIMEKKEPKYQSNQIIQAINTQSPNVKCRETITDAVGHFVMECLSSQAGSFQIEVKPLAANDAAGAATPVTVIFKANPNATPTPQATSTPDPTPTNTPEPTATPTPTSTPIPTMDLAVQERIEDLEAKVLEQETKLSIMESIIKKLEQTLRNLFWFSRD